MNSNIMKLLIVLLMVALVSVVGTSVVVLLLGTLQPWPIPSGTLEAKKVSVEGESYIMIQGEPMNALGQVQVLDVELDEDAQKLTVSRYIVRWNPFSEITVNNQWPVFFALESVKPGKYAVVYSTKEGEATAGYFEVP